MDKICGLGYSAEEAAKAGYKNADGTVNLLMANMVSKKFGKLVPKNSLSASDLREFEGAIKKIDERLNIKTDVFQKK